MQRTDHVATGINLAIEGNQHVQNGELKVSAGLLGTVLTGLTMLHPMGTTYHGITIALYGINMIVTAAGVMEISQGRHELAEASGIMAHELTHHRTFTTRIFGMFSSKAPDAPTSPPSYENTNTTPHVGSNPSSPLLNKGTL